MKLLTSSDWHLSVKGPVSRTDDWQETMFNKLSQISRVAVSQKCKAILCAGDVFDRTARVDFGLLYRLLSWCFELKRQGVLVIGIPGNHDLIHDRYDSLPRQPLGIVFASGAMIDASFQSVDLGEGVFVSGIPYPAAKSFSSFTEFPAPPVGKRILLAHCFATPEGGSVFKEPAHRYSDLYSLPFDLFVFGHDHSDHGVVSLRGQLGTKSFVNIGALSRGSISRDNLERTVKIALLESTESEAFRVKQLRVQVRSVAEVFDLTLKAAKDREESELEAFTSQLSSDLIDTGPLSFMERLDKMELQDEVRARVKKYLEDAEKVS